MVAISTVLSKPPARLSLLVNFGMIYAYILVTRHFRGFLSMAKNSMLRRAFHQAMIQQSTDKAEKESSRPEQNFIRNYIRQYAEKNEVEISEEEIDTFVANQLKLVKY